MVDWLGRFGERGRESGRADPLERQNFELGLERRLSPVHLDFDRCNVLLRRKKVRGEGDTGDGDEPFRWVKSQFA